VSIVCILTYPSSALERISNSVQDRKQQSGKLAFWNYMKDPSSIDAMRRDLDSALGSFQVRFFSLGSPGWDVLILPISWNS
jgi:hypothetical protein